LLSVTVHLLHQNHVCSYKHGAEKILSLSNIQPYSSESCLSIHTYTHKLMLTIGSAAAPLERPLSR